MGKKCLEEVRRLIGKKDCENRSKKRRGDFSREREMPFKKLIWFMLGLAKESSQNALERFFPKIKEAARMSQQALQRGAAKWEAGSLRGAVSRERPLS
jgi:hypothetical protein